VSLRQRWFRDKLQKKAQKGFQGYPIATIAYYGSDDQHATKVVVGIVMTEGGGAEILEKWFSTSSDVRSDPDINQSIVHFIRTNAARSVVIADHIIGCPHEEGTDYPLGEKCPRCPFWATRDRWSGEMIQ
jgi:hypothetical protein